MSSYAEKDHRYRFIEDEELRHKDNNMLMSDDAVKSKFNFNNTVCKNNEFNVIALGKQSIG